VNSVRWRSLAYTTSGRVEIPKLLNEGMYFETYAACQADKADETAALLVELGQRMPEKTEREELVKKGLQEYCLSTVPDHRNRVFYQVAWKRRGFKEDPHEFIYHKADSLKISDVFSFYKTQLSPAPYTLIVVGNKRKMDRKQLAKLGKIRYLRKREFSKH
jgi:zinc protease